MTLWTFAAPILPPLLAAPIASGLGGAALSPRITTGSVVPLTLFGLLLFVAMVTFKRARGWNAALLVAFSFVAGGVVNWLFEDRIGGGWLGGGAGGVRFAAVLAP